LRKFRWARADRAIIAAAVFATAGCSTVIKTTGSESAVDAPQRAALIDAARMTAQAPWPKPSSSSLAEVLAGGEQAGPKVTRDDAIDAYVASLGASGEAKIRLIADVGRHIEAAEALKAAAEAACDTSASRLSDVSLLEDAISDLRETRAIYAASFKKIGGEKFAIEEVKRQFDDTLKALGEAADRMAETAVRKRTEYLANGAATLASAGSR
jgi:hypothetical protein